MDSINHCLVFIIAKTLDINKCNDYNIPVKFAYENYRIDSLNNKLIMPFNDLRLFEKFY